MISADDVVAVGKEGWRKISWAEGSSNGDTLTHTHARTGVGGQLRSGSWTGTRARLGLALALVFACLGSSR